MQSNLPEIHNSDQGSHFTSPQYTGLLTNANVQISIKEAPQILIPLSSVLMNNESSVVYVESSPWVCERREIELGDEDGQFVRVLSGLKPGERIVTCGGMFLNDK